MLWAGRSTAGATHEPSGGKGMAEGCTIPCNARALRASLQGRLFSDETYSRLPVLGAALLIAVAGPVIALLIAPPITAVVLAGWGLLGAAIVLGQAWLGAATPAERAMPAELRRLVEANTARIHPPRVASLQERAAVLSLDQPNFGAYATRLLQDLREATGEAWRCPCRKRRLPLPF